MLKKIRPDHIEKVKDLLPPSHLKEFQETYMSDLKSWHAFGLFDGPAENVLKGISCCFYSAEAPEWFYIKHYCDDNEDLKTLVNETCKRFESFEIRKFIWAERSYDIDFLLNYIPVRYSSYFMYEVLGWLRSPYTRHFNILYSGQWCPADSAVNFSVLESTKKKR